MKINKFVVVIVISSAIHSLAAPTGAPPNDILYLVNDHGNRRNVAARCTQLQVGLTCADGVDLDLPFIAQPFAPSYENGNFVTPLNDGSVLVRSVGWG